VELLAVPYDAHPRAIAAALNPAPGVVILLDSRHIVFDGVEQVHAGNLVAFDAVDDVRAAALARARDLPRLSEKFEYCLDIAVSYIDDTARLVLMSSLLAAMWKADA